MKETCLTCGGSWSRDQATPRHPCTHCGEPRWDVESPLDNVGMRNEYRVLAERVLDGHVLALDLQGVNISHAPCVVLPHRLKNDYRHRKNDLMVQDGRDLVVVFDKASAGPKAGLPVIAELKRVHRTSPSPKPAGRSVSPATQRRAEVEMARESRKQQALQLRQQREQWRRLKDVAKAIGWVSDRLDGDEDE